MAKAEHSPVKKTLATIIAFAIIAAAIGAFWLYQRKTSRDVMTDNAVLSANIVNIAASVPGRVVEIHAEDNQRVSKGDLLFAIDAEPYRFAAAQAAADLKLAEAARDTQRRTISAEQSNAGIADQQIARAKTNLALTESTVKRLAPLAEKGYVSAQSFEIARTARDDARTSLEQAHRQAKAATSLVSTLDASEALVQARRAALDIASTAVSNTRIYAPHDGFVVGLQVSPGQVVAPGQALFTLIDSGQWFATAVFPETQLGKIEIGSCAKINLLSDRSETLQGTVSSIGWGVASGSMINLPFSVPYVPKTEEWVHIIQRFPVRIAIKDPPERLMRMGASAVVVVQGGSKC